MASSDRFVLRPLQHSDYHKQHLRLLAQLTQAPDLGEQAWQGVFTELGAHPETYCVLVVEDTEQERLVGSATLVIEQKFLRGGGKCGHIEDVVVDEHCRGHGLGLRLIRALTDLARDRGCYKVILDCSEENAAFYSKAGLVRKEVQMVQYL